MLFFTSSYCLSFLQLALGEPGKQRFFPFVGGSRETWKQGLLKNFPREEAALDNYIAKLKVTIELNATYILSSLLLIMDYLSLVQRNTFSLQICRM